MTLSPSQRLEAYRWAYRQKVSYTNLGICVLLYHWLVNNGLPGDEKQFHEFMAFKPSKDQVYWFESIHERLTCLAFCIAMIQTDLDSDDYETAFINSLKD